MVSTALWGGSQPDHLADRVIPILNAAGIGAAALGPALEHHLLHRGLEDLVVRRSRLDLDHLASLAERALASPGAAVQPHRVLIDDGFPPGVGLSLHLTFDESPGLVVELAQGGEAAESERHGEADGQRDHMGGHLVPAGLVGRRGAGDAAIDGAALQRGNDIGEWHGHPGAAEGLYEIAHRGALHANPLALDVRQALERRFAVDDRRRPRAVVAYACTVLLLGGGA